MYRSEDLEALIGKSVSEIWFSESNLTFNTDEGYVSYEVYGDCCSYSHFFDFYGVRNLLKHRLVTNFESVQLSPGDVGYTPVPERVEYDDCTQVYGYRITTEHPVFGPVSSVFSFRNESNGYYGGWMDKVDGKIYKDQVQLFDDKIG